MRVLVTGAGGYIGSRLVPELLARSHDVVAGFTTPARSTQFPWCGQVEVVRCNVLDAHSVEEAVHRVDAVVYLVHRMASGTNFQREDADGAATMCEAMARAQVDRCVYLSGLQPSAEPGTLSTHMASRGQVEQILSAGPTPTLTLRAGVILGEGSTSFEVVRALCELLPIQPVPTWMRHHVEPVAEVDVLEALCGALTGRPRSGHADLGCGEQLTYPDLLRLYSQVAGLATIRIPVPPVPWDLVAHGLARVIPQDPVTVAAMIESLHHDMVCADRTAARELFPHDWQWTSAREAIHVAVHGSKINL